MLEVVVPHSVDWLTVATIVWLAGLALLLGWNLYQYLRLRRRTASAIRAEDGAWVCDGIAGPFVLGALRPKIYLPCWLGEESRAHVLAHESCHLRRHDPLIRLIALFTTALHWFNPLVWLGFKLMEQDMEMSCDEAALRALGAEKQKDYSRTLLALGTGRRGYGPALAFGMPAVKKRILHVLNLRRTGRRTLALASAVLLLAGLTCCTDAAPKTPTGQIRETMARKYLIDSVLYWAQEYHIDGFRFDLMGLYDVDTMNELRAALDALPCGRNILMYGEPWQGGGSQLHRYEANKANLAMLSERIGIFCDNTRDVIKGGCFDAREPGYVEGKPGSFWDIGGAVAAWCRSDKLPAHSPSQIVSYVSAHDNFTLWDKLMLVRYARPEYTAADSAALAQNRLAAGIYLTCMGMPFLQAGEEFARTKKGQGNTYRSSPSLNRLDWKRAAQFHGLVDYYRGLLGLRAQFPRLSASDAASPAAIRFFSLEQPLVGWTLPAAPGDGAAWRALCVFYNPTEEEKRVRLPDGQWKLLSDGVSSALWKGPSRVCGGEVTLLPYSATIFGQV